MQNYSFTRGILDPGLREEEETLAVSWLPFGTESDFLLFAALKYGRLGGKSSDPCFCDW